MANNNAHADFVTTWETTLTNVKARAAELPDLTAYVTPLEIFLGEAKSLQANQKALTGIKQQETQNLLEVMAKGREAAIRLRAALKAHYGPRSERLVEFGMRPPRKRARTTNPEVKPKPVVPAPASDPAE